MNPKRYQVQLWNMLDRRNWWPLISFIRYEIYDGRGFVAGTRYSNLFEWSLMIGPLELRKLRKHLIP